MISEVIVPGEASDVRSTISAIKDYTLIPPDQYLDDLAEYAKNMTRDVLIGAGIGILAGLLGVAFSGGDNFGRNMAVFGGIGAATGALRGAAQRGQDANIQADTPLQLILTQPVKVNVYQSL